MSDGELNYSTFRKGQVIFRRGDKPDFAYLVTSGAIEIVVESGGREEVIDTAGPGDVFGEMSLVENLPRSASARASEDTICAAFSMAHVQECLAKA